jgi:hypothetical protein
MHFAGHIPVASPPRSCSPRRGPSSFQAEGHRTSDGSGLPRKAGLVCRAAGPIALLFSGSRQEIISFFRRLLVDAAVEGAIVETEVGTGQGEGVGTREGDG